MFTPGLEKSDMGHQIRDLTPVDIHTNTESGYTVTGGGGSGGGYGSVPLTSRIPTKTMAFPVHACKSIAVGLAGLPPGVILHSSHS